MQFRVKTNFGNFNCTTKLKNKRLIKESISAKLGRKFGRKPSYIFLESANDYNNMTREDVVDAIADYLLRIRIIVGGELSEQRVIAALKRRHIFESVCKFIAINRHEDVSDEWSTADSIITIIGMYAMKKYGTRLTPYGLLRRLSHEDILFDVAKRIARDRHNIELADDEYDYDEADADF